MDTDSLLVRTHCCTTTQVVCLQVFTYRESISMQVHRDKQSACRHMETVCKVPPVSHLAFCTQPHETLPNFCHLFCSNPHLFTWNSKEQYFAPDLMTDLLGFNFYGTQSTRASLKIVKFQTTISCVVFTSYLCECYRRINVYFMFPFQPNLFKDIV